MFQYAGNMTLGQPGMIFQAISDIPKGGDIFNRYYEAKASLTAREKDEDGDPVMKSSVISGAVTTWGFGTPDQDDVGFVGMDWGT